MPKKEYNLDLEGWKAVGAIGGIMAVGFAVGLIFCSHVANACEPCVQPEPQCGYEQVVNPITGQLEQEYVCR